MFQQVKGFFENFDWSWMSLAKVGAGIVFFVVLFSFIGNSFSQRNGYDGYSVPSKDMSYGLVPPMPALAPSMGYGGGESFSMNGVAEKMMVATDSVIAPQWIPQSMNGGRNAEQYERVGYSARYEAVRTKPICEKIESWKPLTYVVFDSASESEYGCDYQFRVEKEKADEIVTQLKTLDPKDWSVYTNSIAQGIEDTTDRLATLKTRLASLNDTLVQVERSYNQLVILATKNEKVGDLANILNNKLSMIERLTNDKLNLEDQIKQATGGKGDQIDDAAYAHFSVSVSRIVVVDWKNIGESWRQSLQSAVSNISTTLAMIVFGIPALLVTMLWYGLVLGIAAIGLTLFVKILLSIVKKIWNA